MKIEDIKKGENYWVYKAGGRKRCIVQDLDPPHNVHILVKDYGFSWAHPRQITPIKKKPKVKLGRTFWIPSMGLEDFRTPPDDLSDWIEVRQVLK